MSSPKPVQKSELTAILSAMRLSILLVKQSEGEAAMRQLARADGLLKKALGVTTPKA